MLYSRLRLVERLKRFTLRVSISKIYISLFLDTGCMFYDIGLDFVRSSCSFKGTYAICSH